MIASSAPAPLADQALAGYRAIRARRRLTRTLVRLTILAVIVGGWEYVGQTTSRLFIAPFSESIVLVADPAILEAWATSAQALLVGYVAAALVGVGIGLAMGRSTLVERAVNPYLTIFLATPMVAVMPIMIVLFGLTLTARIAVVFVFSFVEIAVNALAGTKSVQPELLEMGRSFSLTAWQRFRSIVLPGAGPLVMNGLRLGFGRAVIGMLLSEMLLLTVGIGGLLIESANRFATAKVFAIVITILVVAWGGGTLIEAIDRRLNRWSRRSVA